MKKKNTTTVKATEVPFHVGASRALRRAAKVARETSRRTNTPLILWRDGKVVREKV